MERKKLKLMGFVAVSALAVFAAVFAYNRFAGQIEMPVAAPAGDIPRIAALDFAMTDWDGNSLRFSDIVAGQQPIVLNFWASWCPACRSESPVFQEAYLEMGGEIKFVKLNLVDGARETVESGKRYVEEGGFTFPVYFDTEREGVFGYGLRSIPLTLFIDREGYIVTAINGPVTETTLRMGIDFIR